MTNFYSSQNNEQSRVSLFNGDVLQWCEEYDGEKFHAMLCDPPYHLGKGFMGKDWDGGDIAFKPETWAALGEHLHPGAFCFAFASTRGVHRMACAIEDAGFILHPTIFLYAFGAGFPKATRIDTQIDRAAGAEREVVGRIKGMGKHNPEWNGTAQGRAKNSFEPEYDATKPATDLAKAWRGHRYGRQSLKPASEPCLSFSKPIVSSLCYNSIVEITFLVEVLQCLDLPVRDATTNINRIHQVCRQVVEGSVHLNADVWASLESVRIAGDSSASNLATSTLRSFVAAPAPTPEEMRQAVQTIVTGEAVSISVKAIGTSKPQMDITQSIASLWSEVLGEVLNHQSRYTIETVTSLTTDLKTLNWCLSQSTSRNITDHSEPTGHLSFVQNAESLLRSVLIKLQLLPSITAEENATERQQQEARDLAESKKDGEGLKPAVEPIICFQLPYTKGRRPVDCITETGAGALNIDAARIEGIAQKPWGKVHPKRGNHPGWQLDSEMSDAPEPHHGGRWPANFCVDEEAAARLDLQSGVSQSKATMRGNLVDIRGDNFGRAEGRRVEGTDTVRGFNDTGGASRFFLNTDWNYEVEERLAESEPAFYAGKASRRERNAGCEENENNHPTVKPQKLTTWLATLLLPPGIYAPRRILVPFSGVASEIVGCIRAGWEEIVGIEGEAEYCRIAQARIDFAFNKHAPKESHPVLFSENE